MRPDGSLASRCANHGGLTPNPRTAVLTDMGRQTISATSKATWERYRADKAAGRPIAKVGRPKLPARLLKPKRRRKPGRIMSDTEWLKAIGVIS
jgi:hypothetical protein